MNCRGCGAEILWTRTDSGKRMPLDPTPTPNGNVHLVEGRIAVVLTKEELALTEGGRLYLSHFATCPARAKFPKGG